MESKQAIHSDMLELVSLKGKSMQAFGVKLLEMGPKRVEVLAIVRPLSGLSPSECRNAVDAGPIVVAVDLMRADAMNLVRELTDLGAVTEVFISIDES